MKRLSLAALLLLLLLNSGEGQTSFKGLGEFRVSFDIARFYGDENKVFVEMYYGFHENILTYVPSAGEYTGSANMKYVIRNDSGIVDTKQWTVPHTIADSTQLTRSRILTGLESAALLPGSYHLTLTTYDANNAARRDSMTVPFTVDAFPPKPSFSDIELCTSIQASGDKQSIFYKNTLEVVPNPGRLFGTGLPIMYYYVEVYNLSKDSSDPTMTVHAAVLDATGKELLTHDKLKPRLHDASVEIGTMNLSALRSGSYTFRVSLVDSSNVAGVSASKRFFVYKLGSAPDTAINAINSTSSEYALRSEADLDKEFDYARYISTEQEKKQYGMITDVAAKRRFLFDFWERHNTSATAGENSFKKEYFKRIDAANRDYFNGTKEGWKSDHGRVLIMYGQPDEIDRHPSTSESSPYEIWNYNSLQGGVIFVFVDRKGLNDFQLVHSTHRDELQDENWYNDYAVKAE
ncbi:MAG TPA: GWxTD domain-containing protein [Bacteroidota bacterium]|jgi:GWxTD domain-containing protein|nr:GWxTD domain-containing protein [Bacteroidota bacterium]